MAGKFKIEKQYIKQFVGLSSKCYSILQEFPSGVSESEEKCRGLNKNFIKDKKHDFYLSVLDEEKQVFIESRHIRSRNQQLHTITQNKKGFHPFELKRYHIDGINTLPYGSKRIKLMEQEALLDDQPLNLKRVHHNGDQPCNQKRIKPIDQESEDSFNGEASS